MMIEESEFRKRIYDLMNGNWNLRDYPVPEARVVSSEFEPGSECAIAYQQMLDAYSRLCRRLSVGEWEDTDVEIVIGSLLAIGRHLALKMFEYGVLFARRE